MVNYTQKLPIYDYLLAQLTERVGQGKILVDAEFKSKLSSILNSLDPSRATEVALLLIHFYFLTNPEVNPFNAINCTTKSGKTAQNLPFGIRVSTGGVGFHFDLDQLPQAFQALLGIYCSM